MGPLSLFREPAGPLAESRCASALRGSRSLLRKGVGRRHFVDLLSLAFLTNLFLRTCYWLFPVSLSPTLKPGTASAHETIEKAPARYREQPENLGLCEGLGRRIEGDPLHPGAGPDRKAAGA